MGRVLQPASVEIWLCDEEGIRIALLDYCTEYEYIKVANNYGPFRILLPASFNRELIHLDNIVEFWRGYGPGNLSLDYCGFLRAWTYGDINGLNFTQLYGASTNELLTRRIVANYSGSAQAKMTDQADDLMKAVAKDQLGADTTAARDLTSVGGGFTIQADLADGQSITKAFAWRNVLEVFQDICDASNQAGTRVYFEMVPIVSSSVTGKLAFQLRTTVNQPGNDRTDGSYAPVFVGPDWGNFQNGTAEFDYTEEINHSYVLGQGEQDDREYSEVSDSTAETKSIWNRREGARDARHIELGDTAALTAEGYTYLREHMPMFRLSGDVVETPAFRYGRDWGFGDRVEVSYQGVQVEAILDRVHVSRGEDGQEVITARLEVLE